MKLAHPFVDAVLKELGIKSDAELSRRTGIKPPFWAKIRHKVLHITPRVILALHEHAGMEVPRIRELMAQAQVTEAAEQ
jgi:hypothetical protein